MTPVGAGANYDVGAGVAVQADGMIVAAGQADPGTGSGVDFAVTRYLPGGALDPAFGAGGKLTTAISIGTASDGAQTVLVQPDGKIVAAGYTYPSGGGERRFALVRYIGLEADLALGQDAGPTSVRLGSKLPYNLTMTNFGVDTAANSTVVYTVPPGAEFDSATASQGTCSGVTTIVCGLGSLAPGASATARIVVRTTAPGTLAGCFSAAGQYYDPNPGNNAIASSVTVTNARPDSNIRRLPRKIGARKLKSFRGTASDDYGVAKVEIAVYKQSPGICAAPRRGAKCRWLASSRGGFKRPRARKNRCSKPVCLKARGRTRWTFKLKRPLPSGSYVVYSRATDKAGLVENRFSKRDRNRIAFKVTR